MKKVIIIALVVVALAVIGYMLWKKFGTKVDDTTPVDETNSQTVSNIQLLPVNHTLSDEYVPTASQEFQSVTTGELAIIGAMQN